MTIQEFGQQIKQKYPQYNNLQDIEVGQKVLDKYPQYRDMVQPDILSELGTKQQEKEVKPQEGILSKIGKGAYEISGAKAFIDWTQLPSKVLETKIEIETSKGLSESRKKLADLTTKLVKQWRTEKNPTRKEKLQRIITDNFKQMGMVFEEEKEAESRMTTPKQALGTTIKAGATVAAYGAGVPTTTKAFMGQAGVIGAGLGAGEALEQGKDIKEVAKQAFLTGATSAITAGVLKVGSEKVTKILKGAPTKLYNSALKATKKLIKQKKTGVDVLIKEGHFGTLGTITGKIESGIQNIESIIGQKLSGATGTIRSSDVMDEAVNRLRSKYGSLYTQEQVENMILKSPIADLIEKETLTLVEANALRRQLDRMLRESFFLREGESALSREVSGAITNILRRMIQKASGTTDEFATYAGYVRAQKLIDNAVAHTDKYFGIGLKDLVLIGAVPGTGFADVGAVAIKKGLESATAKTGLAVGIDRLNQLISKMPTDKAGKISKIAILNLIKRLTAE